MFLARLLLTAELNAMAQVTERFPILAISRLEGEHALLEYRLTTGERALFREIDAETAKLPADAPLEQNHSLVEQIVAKHGLSRAQSIAFWTRATFSLFEPEGLE